MAEILPQYGKWNISGKLVAKHCEIELIERDSYQ